MRHPDTLPPPARTTAPAAGWERTYPGLPAQARIVRADLRPLLAGCPAVDDVLLLASELAANAIAHSDSGRPGGTFTVRLTHEPGSGVRAEVADQGSTWPGDLPVCAQPPHGLYLLQALSTACGARRDGRARIVWFRLDHCCGPALALPRPADGPPRRGGGRPP
jgi:serine/threonine-protein kinase RsbW